MRKGGPSAARSAKTCRTTPGGRRSVRPTCVWGPMAKQLDVYRDWLGISEAERPLSYYQILKLPPFEDDAEKVRASYRKLNAHVRRYQTGEFGPQSQQLLNELAKAMLCLTDAHRKGDYDASLGRVRTGEASGRRSSRFCSRGRWSLPTSSAGCGAMPTRWACRFATPCCSRRRSRRMRSCRRTPSRRDALRRSGRDGR